MSAEPLRDADALGGDAVLRAIQDIAAAVGGVLEADRVGQVVVERAGALLDAGVVRLYLWSEVDGELRPLASAGGAGIHEPGQPLHPGEGAAGQAFLLRAPVAVECYDQWEHARPSFAEGGVRSAAGVPLLVADRAIGALVLGFYDRRAIRGEALHALSLLAALAAPALEATRLYGLSNRRRIEAEEQAALLAAVLDNMGDAVLVTDREGRIVLANPAAARLFGVAVERLVGLALADQPWVVFGPDGTAVPPEQRPLGRALTGERVYCDYHARMADGVERFAAASASPLLDADGGVRGAVAVVRDLTAQRDAARHADYLSRTERLRALGQLASGVAHDLSQSLALIAGYADLAAQTVDGAGQDLEGLRDMLPTIARAAMDGGETLRRLLVFARQGTAISPEPVDVGEVLAEVGRLSAPHWRDAAQVEGRTIRLTVEADRGLVVQGSASELREALMNLVFNAVDALPAGGAIALRARRRGEGIVLDVADSGVGMSPDVQARIFEPFFTTKGERGTGLGLAQVFGIVERHGGRIGVRSAPARGTTFSITLPAAGATETVVGAPPPAPEPQPARRILVVDDEETLVGMAAEVLRRAGHTVATAYSGEQALDRLGSEPIDVVVSDMGMGEGINGLQLAERVRAEWPGVRFVLATGWGAALDQTVARDRGVAAIVAKPYRAQALLQAIRG